MRRHDLGRDAWSHDRRRSVHLCDRDVLVHGVHLHVSYGDSQGDGKAGQVTPCPKPVKQVRARKPMKRAKGLRRTWIKKKPPKRLKRAGANRDYLQWLHRRPGECRGAFSISHTCDGPIQAAHFRNMTGGGRKEPDKYAIDICTFLHDCYDRRILGKRSPFDGWTTEERKIWFMSRVIEANAAYELETGKTL